VQQGAPLGLPTVTDCPRTLLEPSQRFIGAGWDVSVPGHNRSPDRVAVGSGAHDAHTLTIAHERLRSVQRRRIPVIKDEADEPPSQPCGALLLQSFATVEAGAAVCALELGEDRETDPRLHRRLGIGQVCVPVAEVLFGRQRVDGTIASVGDGQAGGRLQRVARLPYGTVDMGGSVGWDVKFKAELSNKREAEALDVDSGNSDRLIGGEAEVGKGVELAVAYEWGEKCLREGALYG